MENIYTTYPKSTQQSNSSKPRKEVFDLLLNYSAALQISKSKKFGAIDMILN
jgi:hypothetical protein